jgi:hypothetical protein
MDERGERAIPGVERRAGDLLQEALRAGDPEDGDIPRASIRHVHPAALRAEVDRARVLADPHR